MFYRFVDHIACVCHVLGVSPFSHIRLRTLCYLLWAVDFNKTFSNLEIVSGISGTKSLTHNQIRHDTCIHDNVQ